MLRDAVAQGDERAIGATPEHAAVAAAVGLERHADRAVERRPGVVVARVVQVVHVAREVEPPVAVEGGGVRAAEEVEPLPRIADDVRVDGARRRREEVGRDVAVQIGRDHRMPLEHHPHDPLHLALRRGDEIAVHVEAIVIEPPVHAPRLVVLLGARIGGADADGVVPDREALVPVGVGARVDDDDGVAQRRERGRLLAGGELIEELDARLESGRFVAVDRAGDPHHRRRARGDRIDFGGGGAARIGEPVEVAADVVEPRDVLRRRHDVQAHRPALVRRREVLDAHAVLRRAGDGEHHALLRGVLRVRLADRVAEDRFGAGDAGAVGAAIVEREPCVVALRRTLRRCAISGVTVAHASANAAAVRRIAARVDVLFSASLLHRHVDRWCSRT